MPHAPARLITRPSGPYSTPVAALQAHTIRGMTTEIRGALIDVDGVLHVAEAPLPGAVAALAWLRANDLPFALLTNTAVRSRARLGGRLRAIGFDVDDARLLTAGSATADYVRRRFPGRPIFLLAAGDVHEDFAGVPLTEGDDAAAVVIGGALDDAGAMDGWTWERLNHAFRLALGGAKLVGMHRNGFWRAASGLALDSGAYVRGLEYATGARATIVGKPAAPFFRAGARALGLPPEQVVMLGDDLRADVLPAMRLGMRGALVRTGKYRDGDLKAGAPDWLLDSVAGLPGLLGGGTARG